MGPGLCNHVGSLNMCLQDELVIIMSTTHYPGRFIHRVPHGIPDQ